MRSMRFLNLFLRAYITLNRFCYNLHRCCVSFLISADYCFAGGTVPSSLWPREKTVWPRKRPVSSGLRKLLQTTEEIKCQRLQRKCAPFPNKSFGKNTVCSWSLLKYNIINCRLEKEGFKRLLETLLMCKVMQSNFIKISI